MRTGVDRPSPVHVENTKVAVDRTAMRLASLLGFCLPLAGGLPLGKWLHGYPAQVTPIRLVTLAALIWVLWVGWDRPLPVQSRRLIVAILGVLAYAMVSVIWTPDKVQGLRVLITTAMALGSGIALLLLTGRDGRAFPAFSWGVLLAGLVQVVIAAWELATGNHLTDRFGASLIEAYGVVVEALFGRVAWGSMGNPNDLAGFFLLAIALFLSQRAFGLRLKRLQMMVGSAAVFAAIWIGFTSLADARAFQIGLVFVAAMHLLDRALPQGRTTAVRTTIVLLVGWLALAFLLFRGESALNRIVESGGGDGLRLDLVSTAFKNAYLSGGFGRGLGAEEFMLDSGEIATNLHNIVATLANDLGLIVAAMFVMYLLSLFLSWAFAIHSALAFGGQEAALARATLAVVLILYGATSSGVLGSPVYWTFFAATVLISRTNGDSARPCRNGARPRPAPVLALSPLTAHRGP